MANNDLSKRTCVWVIVLGDLGRSPRMQYHALSLCNTVRIREPSTRNNPRFPSIDPISRRPLLHHSQANVDVHLIGYPGAVLIPYLQRKVSEGSLHIHRIPIISLANNNKTTTGRLRASLPRLIALPIKAILQLLILLWMVLFSLLPPSPNVILLQLPPSIPSMIVSWLAAKRHGARLVYDWHNYAFTLMALQSSRQNVLVRIAEWHERRWATACDGALCVSKAMQQDLARNWGVQATVFYDRPPPFFKKATVKETHDLMIKLAPVFIESMHPNDFLAKLAKHDDVQNSSKKQGAAATATTTTICTTKEENPSSSDPKIKLRDGRPAIFVSSTSWTPDEDFRILLNAAVIYDTLVKTNNQRQQQQNAPPSLPNLVILVTGKGPQKASYEHQMASTNLDHVAFRTLWLEPADYPILLGSADLGVSLHSSSSGVDLPMKVVDMLGCSLPVCALSYNCISELVADGKNGLLFGGAEELATQWVELMRGGGEGGGWPGSVPLLERLRKGAEVGGSVKWKESWERIARNVILNNNNRSEKGGGERRRSKKVHHVAAA